MGLTLFISQLRSEATEGDKHSSEYLDWIRLGHTFF